MTGQVRRPWHHCSPDAIRVCHLLGARELPTHLLPSGAPAAAHVIERRKSTATIITMRTGAYRDCESAIFVPHRLPLRCVQPWRCLLLAGEGHKQSGGGRRRRRGARHAPPAPAQALSQNDGYTALILRTSRRARLPHPRAAWHRVVQGAAHSNVQPLPSGLCGRGEARLWAGEGGRNGVEMLRTSARVEAQQRVSDGAKRLQHTTA
jgi:hypothetical protein